MWVWGQSSLTREKVDDSGVDSVGGQVQAFFPLKLSGVERSTWYRQRMRGVCFPFFSFFFQVIYQQRLWDHPIRRLSLHPLDLSWGAACLQRPGRAQGGLPQRTMGFFQASTAFSILRQFSSVQFNSHLFLSPIIIHFFLFFWLFEINGFVEDTVNIDDFPDESSWFCCARRCPQSWLTWPRRQLDYSKLQVRLLRCVLRAALHFPFLPLSLTLSLTLSLIFCCVCDARVCYLNSSTGSNTRDKDGIKSINNVMKEVHPWRLAAANWSKASFEDRPR